MPKHAVKADPSIADIIALNPAGQGVAQLQDRQVAVHGALPGEEISFRSYGGRRGNRRAELVEVLRASPHRIAPRCPHFGVCGGCKLQHLDHNGQLAFKQAQLMDMLLQAGGVAPAEILEPLVGPLWHYRRKARLSVRWVEKKGRVLVGFRELNGRYVADLDECHILDERIAGRLPELASLIAGLSIYNSIPQLEVACGDQLAALVFRVLTPPSEDDEKKLRAFAQASGIAVFLQPAGPDSISALAPNEVQLDYYIHEYGLRLEFGPANFIQVNAGLNQLMISRVLGLLAVSNGDTVLDLFCGLGNFTLPLARLAGTVYGVEGDAGLVSLARHNAGLNGLSNTHFEVADLAVEGVALPQSENGFNKILLDPPRSGAAAVLPAVAASDAEKLVYVSCNPATLALDAAQLVGQYGFRFESAGIMDMFPHTSHIETCATFTR